MTAQALSRANWIWRRQDSYRPYHQVIVARKVFKSGRAVRAVARIAADGQYRLFINGIWVNDGPCRSWPEHFHYDEMDVAAYLREGRNELKIIARHWNVGNFHTVPKQAGLLARLEVEQADGRAVIVATDDTWETAEAESWRGDVPKVSIQMEPQEYYDARLEETLRFKRAAVLYPAGDGPWRDLHARDTALLTREPRHFRTFLGANLVERARDLNFCVPTARLANPDAIEANNGTSNACGLCTLIEADGECEVAFFLEGFVLSIDGASQANGRYRLAAGEHLALAFADNLYGHLKERTFRILDPPALRLVNPLDPNCDNPWCWLPFPEFAGVGDDLNWQRDLNAEDKARNYQERIGALSRAVTDAASFRRHLGGIAQCLPAERMFVQDTHWQFLARKPIGDARPHVLNPQGLMHDNGETTTVLPSPAGDVELLYDLGEQVCGYYHLELVAEEGVEIDLYGVEYIDPDGRIQHTWGNRNGFRYVTRFGVNRFISLKRRSGRYLFITLRRQSAPVSIRLIRVIESTYPVNRVAAFNCSDPGLARIWEISARTLQLCMEDTFTDCPLYEQTLWVGDARNEALYAYTTFGATDIARQSLALAGQSLERYAIVGCQVPSSWDCLLPAWSFLWVLAVWEHYFYTGDRAALAEFWPWVVRNLEGAEACLDARGLFTGPYWNMFDWAGIDDKHQTVLHNSMLAVGAVDAALKAAAALGDETRAGWLTALRRRLVAGINALWDPVRGAYPDSVHGDGTISASISQHTSILALLYDIAAAADLPRLVENILHPPADMVRVGSPFAMMFLYEALEKSGRHEEIVRSIRECYLPMVAAGATTVWEVFPSSGDRPRDFPTRSHCHAWSAAPLHFLARVVLGIMQTAPGGAAFEISPHLCGLAWAEGTVASARGPVRVSWSVNGSVLRVKIRAPEGVRVVFTPNGSHAGLRVELDQGIAGR